MTFETKQAGRITFWIILCLIAATLIVLFLILVNKPFVAQNQEDKSGQKNENQNEAPAELYSYVGKIISIETGKIKILVDKIRNPVIEDSEIAVLVNEATKYYAVSVPKTVPDDFNPEEGGSLFKRTEIKFSDLKTDDDVTVISSENINGKTEFTAKKIEIISNN